MHGLLSANAAAGRLAGAHVQHFANIQSDESVLMFPGLIVFAVYAAAAAAAARVLPG
jgi:hypothetical protein